MRASGKGRYAFAGSRYTACDLKNCEFHRRQSVDASDPFYNELNRRLLESHRRQSVAGSDPFYHQRLDNELRAGELS